MSATMAAPAVYDAKPRPRASSLQQMLELEKRYKVGWQSSTPSIWPVDLTPPSSLV